MAPQETAKLDQLLTELSDHRADFRVFRTKILGDSEGESASGRLPRLEATSEIHEKRIRRIENFILMLIGAAALLKAFAWGAESIAHVFEVLR